MDMILDSQSNSEATWAGIRPPSEDVTTQSSATSSERRFKYVSLCVACLTLLQKEISAVATLSGIVATKRADSHNINKPKDLLGSKPRHVRTFQGKINK